MIQSSILTLHAKLINSILFLFDGFLFYVEISKTIVYIRSQIFVVALKISIEKFEMVCTVIQLETFCKMIFSPISTISDQMILTLGVVYQIDRSKSA